MLPAPWLPVPMHPITMRLLGATVPFAPNADAGTMYGKPVAAHDTSPARFRNARRLIGVVMGLPLRYFFIFPFPLIAQHPVPQRVAVTRKIKSTPIRVAESRRKNIRHNTAKRAAFAFP